MVDLVRDLKGALGLFGQLAVLRQHAGLLQQALDGRAEGFGHVADRLAARDCLRHPADRLECLAQVRVRTHSVGDDVHGVADEPRISPSAQSVDPENRDLLDDELSCPGVVPAVIVDHQRYPAVPLERPWGRAVVVAGFVVAVEVPAFDQVRFLQRVFLTVAGVEDNEAGVAVPNHNQPVKQLVPAANEHNRRAALVNSPAEVVGRTLAPLGTGQTELSGDTDLDTRRHGEAAKTRDAPDDWTARQNGAEIGEHGLAPFVPRVGLLMKMEHAAYGGRATVVVIGLAVGRHVETLARTSRHFRVRGLPNHDGLAGGVGQIDVRGGCAGISLGRQPIDLLLGGGDATVELAYRLLDRRREFRSHRLAALLNHLPHLCGGRRAAGLLSRSCGYRDYRDRGRLRRGRSGRPAATGR